MEAIHYTDAGRNKGRRPKKSTGGGKIHRMALSNLGRNKGHAILTIISISLSLILLNTVFTLSRGFDTDKFLLQFTDTDFLLGHANYFSNLKLLSPEDELSESFISAVQSRPGFREGGRLYYNVFNNQCSIDYDYQAAGFDIKGIRASDDNSINLNEDGRPLLDLYGLEELPLSRLEIVEGEKNKKLLLEKMKTGKYIIEGLHTDDHGNPEQDASHYTVGDIVTIHVDGQSYSYTLLAKAKQKHYTNTNRFYNEFGFYLPAEEFKNIVSHPVLMTYAFNVKDRKARDMGIFVKLYTEKTEPLMNYESKETAVNEFNNIRSMILVVGGALSFIIGLIGMLNFINSVFTSIIARRQEFATMQSIGMTNRQLRKLLIFEGIFYALASAAFSFVFGSLLSIFIVKGIAANLWFFSYQFVISPLMWSYPVLLILSVMIPFAANHGVNKQSIVERLREAE